MPVWLRLAALIISIAVILWLPIEDVNVRYVLILSIAIDTWWATRFIVKLSPDQPRFTVHHIIVGMLAGFAVSPLALFLMVFKSGLHGHGSPDFDLRQMREVMTRAPIWVVAGTLLGLGSAIARLARREEERR